jgi:hypothetical protein
MATFVACPWLWPALVAAMVERPRAVVAKKKPPGDVTRRESPLLGPAPRGAWLNSSAEAHRAPASAGQVGRAPASGDGSLNRPISEPIRPLAGCQSRFSEGEFLVVVGTGLSLTWRELAADRTLGAVEQ